MKKFVENKFDSAEFSAELVVNKVSYYKEETKMTSVNELTSWEMMDKLTRYKTDWKMGRLKFSEAVVNDINLLMESATIIREELVKLFVKFGSTMSEAEYYADINMEEACDMQADWNLKDMLDRLWAEKYYELEGNV